MKRPTAGRSEPIVMTSGSRTRIRRPKEPALRRFVRMWATVMLALLILNVCVAAVCGLVVLTVWNPWVGAPLDTAAFAALYAGIWLWADRD